MWTFPHEKVDTQHWPLPAPILLNIAPWPLLTHQYLMQMPSRHSSACCPSSILMIHMIRRSNWWDDIFGLNCYFSRTRNTSWAESLPLLLHHERPPLLYPLPLTIGCCLWCSCFQGTDVYWCCWHSHLTGFVQKSCSLEIVTPISGLRDNEGNWYYVRTRRKQGYKSDRRGEYCRGAYRTTHRYEGIICPGGRINSAG